MDRFERARPTGSNGGYDTLSRASQLERESDGDCVPVVDAEGRMTGILITHRDVRLAWRAPRGAPSDAILRMV